MTDDDRLANLLGAFALALTDAQTRAMEQAGADNPSVAAALLTLEPNAGMSVEALSLVLGLGPSAASRVAQALCVEGLAERGRGREDARAAALSLTDAGRAMRARLVAARTGALAAPLAALDAGGRAALADLLDAMMRPLAPSHAAADHACRLCDETVCDAERCPFEIAAVAAEGPR